MDISTTMFILYAIGGIVSSVILAMWLHKHRHHEFGESVVVEVICGIMFACFWPATILMMIENNKH